MAIWSRRTEDLKGLVHHSDSEYLAIRYTERLADAGAIRSVGRAVHRWSRTDSYDATEFEVRSENLKGDSTGLFRTPRRGHTRATG